MLIPLNPLPIYCPFILSLSPMGTASLFSKSMIQISWFIAATLYISHTFNIMISKHANKSLGYFKNCYIYLNLVVMIHKIESLSWNNLPQQEWLFSTTAAAASKSLQSCPTLCDPIDGSPPGSPVLGILQARTLERVAISFSEAWKWKGKVKSLSRVRLFATPWTTAYQAPPSTEFSS